jgi:NAD(P)-dependent dehydrogenase (short-subunit alcohol dehydrogenase family)
MRLVGKKAIVTGASAGGTGFGIASRFLKEGASVFICEIGGQNLAEALHLLEPLGDASGQTCDVARREDATMAVAAAGARLGGIDILVNNAAVSTPGLLLKDMDDAAIAANLGAGLYGTLYMMQAPIRTSRKAGVR